ncbi:MAG: NYN domain-containing protein [Hyphomicrobiaceae bacterium]
MAQESAQPILTAVFVDYDNIYLSLKKRSEEAAKRFSKDASVWIKELEAGRLISATNSPAIERPRRIVLNRCYGNPVPRRNQHDNSTDMNSFPFVRHHFLRAGFEVIDCPPLTAQLKNSSDIKMVMDVRDFLNHATHFDEFIIMSGDADFTPVLHRLRAHARRTVIFANDYTAAPYTAIADGEIRESQLLAAILEHKIASSKEEAESLLEKPKTERIAAERPNFERLRAEILSAVVAAVRAAGGPVPLEALAERTTRALGHDMTIGTSWAGSGSFLELLRRGLPNEIQLTSEPPYLAFEAGRNIGVAPPSRQIEARERVELPLGPVTAQRTPAPVTLGPLSAGTAETSPQTPAPIPAPMPGALRVPTGMQAAAKSAPQAAAPTQAAPKPQAAPATTQQQQRQPDIATSIQQSIARIHDACQAPPLSPPEYRAVFEIIAKELNQNGLQGSQTLSNITTSAQELGIALKRDDVRFIMDVVSEADPWFEQGASANLFAGRFRNFVVARCRSQGLNLSSDELDLIEAWFAGTGQPLPPQNVRVPAASSAMESAAQTQPSGSAWSDDERGKGLEHGPGAEEFPKILRTRLRG